MVPTLSGCTGSLSTLAPQGPAAEAIALLWWGMLAGATLITLLVLLLLARGFLRPQGSAPKEGFWIKGMGLGFTGVILAVLVAASIMVGERLQPLQGADVVRVEAVARQWSWHFVQPGKGGVRLATQGRLYIPAGQPVEVEIRSQDVIHSFWVPQLAGKMDAVPGRANRLRIEAHTPGLYHGRSAEFSGIGYAAMRFEVLAYDPADPPPFTDLAAPPAATEPLAPHAPQPTEALP